MITKEKMSPRPVLRRGGRPTPEQAIRIAERIVETGAELFFGQGFEATSIEQIAAVARISKRTFYTRFASKEALFAAVVRHKADLFLHHLEDVNERSGTLEDRLIEIGLGFSHASFSEEAIALDRLVTTEAKKFPELAHAFYDFAVSRAIKLVARVFTSAHKRHEIKLGNAEFLAEQFIYSVVSGPLRKVVLGIEKPLQGAELYAFVRSSVRLFLEGGVHSSKDIFKK